MTLPEQKPRQVKCRECGTQLTRANLIKEWNATPKAKAGEIQVTIHYWQCPKCREKFRTATRIWLKPKQSKTAGSKLQKIRQKLSQRQAQGTTR
ncbi:MAG: hypothetical protein QXV21_03405 [Candidatus Bathyarchaeia archaeon]